MPNWKKSYKGRNYKNYSGRRKPSKSNTVSIRKPLIKEMVKDECREIARQEIRKNRLNLVKRNYLFGEYDPEHNEFADGLQIDFTGLVVPLSQIGLNDAAAIVNVPPTDIPETMEDENADGDGVNQVAEIQTRHGRRTTDSIKLTGASLDVRVKYVKDTTAETDYDQVEVRYAILALKVRSTDAGVAFVDPPARRLLEWNPFGYSPALDTVLNQEMSEDIVKVICKGKTFVTANEMYTDIKFDNIYKRLNTPLTLNFAPGDQNGTTPLRWRIYAVFRSSVPAALDDYQPIVHAAAKLYYYEP